MRGNARSLVDATITTQPGWVLIDLGVSARRKPPVARPGITGAAV
jgi:hypothetical protein